MDTTPVTEPVQPKPSGFDAGLKCLTAVFLFTVIVRVGLTLANKTGSRTLVGAALVIVFFGLIALVVALCIIWSRRATSPRPARRWALVVAYAMKNPSTKNWLIDSLIVGCITGIAVFLLPLVLDCSNVISEHLRHSLYSGHSLFWVHTFLWIQSFALGELLSYVIVGCMLGLATAWLIRHRKLALASLPAILLCIFYFLFFSFVGEHHSRGQLRPDVVLVCNWLLLVIASLFCARFCFTENVRPNNMGGAAADCGFRFAFAVDRCGRRVLQLLSLGYMSAPSACPRFSEVRAGVFVTARGVDTRLWRGDCKSLRGACYHLGTRRDLR